MNKIEIQNNRAPYLFRYRSNNENTIDELKSNYIYFPNAEKLNDPFDANSDMLEFSKEASEYEKLYEMLLAQIPDTSKDYFARVFKNNPSELYSFADKNKEEFILSFGIACFTMSEINLPLWASYSNNHQGLCIQYNMEFDKTFFQGLRKVDYFKRFKKIKYLPATDSSGFQEILFKKFHLWKNEYELRLVKMKTGKHHYNPLALRNIIFGLRATDEFKNQIIEIVKQKYPHAKLYQPILFKSTFEIGFQELIINFA